MSHIRLVSMALALWAGLSAAPAQSQPYGRESFCFYVGGYLRCEQRPVGARSYMGNAKWCLYREGMLGETALCSYPTYRGCLNGRAMNRGSCVLNPDFAEAMAPPPRR
jgi:hypothetical protein